MIEEVLLFVELVLLSFTIVLLLLSRKEWQAREQLLNLLMATARVLTRQEYFSMVKEALARAQKNVFAIVTGTSPGEKDRPLVEEVLQAISTASKKGVSLSYLLPKSPETLEMGSRYMKAGARVRYHDGLVISDFRFMIVDERFCAIGLPEMTGEGQPTRRGILIKTETLADLLKDHFNKFWSPAEDYNSYLGVVVLKLVEENPQLSAETISRQLRVDAEEISRILMNK